MLIFLKYNFYPHPVEIFLINVILARFTFIKNIRSHGPENINQAVNPVSPNVQCGGKDDFFFQAQNFVQDQDKFHIQINQILPGAGQDLFHLSEIILKIFRFFIIKLQGLEML